jgi:hypothetical protein
MLDFPDYFNNGITVFNGFVAELNPQTRAFRRADIAIDRNRDIFYKIGKDVGILFPAAFGYKAVL